MVEGYDLLQHQMLELRMHELTKHKEDEAHA